MRLLAKTLLTLALLACNPAFAEEQPPARVGRVSLISGTLAFYGPGDSDWSAAKVNYPVAAGEWFATDPQSRAEIRIGAATIDIAADTQLEIADLGDRAMKAGVTQGRIDINLRQFGQNESAEINMPRGVVWLLERGIYDVETGAADQPTRISVFEGSARFVGGGADLIVRAGDALVLRGSDTVAATVERATIDDFVKWCRSRDYRQDRLAAPYHVPPAMTGFEELDAYGGWGTVPDYGTVWYPNSVPADWAPYRDGHWVWVEPWGWNWVDAEPWGFAPFHYGRWAHIDDRWGWVPGNFVPQPVYAPALVAFIEVPGIGPSAPVETGPAVGWFPLAPGEVYWPNYTRDPIYIRNVNIANVSATNITEIKTIVAARRTNDPPPQVANQQFVNRGAATVVPARVFADSARVAPAARAVPAPALQRAPVSLRPPELTPTIARPASPAPTASAPAMQPAHGPSAQAALPAPGQPPGHPLGHPPGPPNFSGLAPAPSGPHGRPQLAQQPLQAPPAVPAPGHPPGPPNFSNLAPAAGSHGQPAVSQQPAPASSTQGHPPEPPNFSHLAPAAAAHGEPALTQQPAQAAPAPPMPDHPPGPPNFSHLVPAAVAHGQPAVTQQPAQAAPAAPTPGHPPGPPNFSHLVPATGYPRQAPKSPPGQAAQGGPPVAAHAQPPAIAQAPAPHSLAPPSPQAPQHQNQGAVEQATQQRAAAQAAAQQQAQQRAAAQAAAQQQAQQRAAPQAAAQQQAQQRAAAQAAAQQQAQQRAAAQAAAQQQAQQRAAAQTAAQQQAQQRAAAQAAAQQQAQQRAAAQTAAQQQAQQRAAAQAAAQQQAQQRAAAQAAAQQQPQQRAAAQQQAQQRAATVGQQAQAHGNCGHPGQQACPR